MRRALPPLFACLTLLAGGCKQAREKYYNTLERVGVERRELLVSRVGRAREAQQEAQQEFKDALEQFQAVVGYDGGDLEKMYAKLSGAYDDARARADAVTERIRKVEEVAGSLFEEWRREIGEYRDPALRAESERELAATRRRYDQLLAVMKKAARPMEPVLARLHDQVLFLKHNLNARALGSLQGTARELEVEVGDLLTQMQASIAEADRFIAEMKKP